MTERVRYILSVAARHGHGAIVLGVFGCGVFKNEPEEIAAIFKQVLIGEQYSRLFHTIVFAVLDTSANRRVLRAFERGLQANQ